MISDIQIAESVAFIRNAVRGDFPKSAVILGSGLGGFSERLRDVQIIAMDAVPSYPRPTVEGHAGRILIGTLESSGKIGISRNVCIFQGRTHFYECGTVEQVAYPIYVMNKLGIENLLITNAAGGINKAFKPGDLMVIRDQINLTFRHIFAPGTIERSVRSELYDHKKCSLIIECGHDRKVELQQGVYGGVLGPSYETAAEIRMLRSMGADAVGMSTVLEVLQANFFDMRIAGISCITNYAAGIGEEKLSHQDVTRTAAKVNEKFITLLKSVLTHPGWES